MGSRITKKYVAVVIVLLTLFGIVYRHNSKNCNAPLTEYIGPQRFVVGDDVNGNQQKYSYDRFLPLIFIGGMPRSGTTLLRATLDAHPDIRCGEETRVIPRVLGFRQQWMKAPFESRRLKEAGITPDVLDSAVTSFILEIIVKHGPPAPRLCNKDPFTLRSAVYLKQLFPNAKFVFMIRDGRAVVHSIISRKVTISGFDLKDPRQCLKKWNSAMHAMNFQCEQLGPSVCLPLHYEKLVLNPKFWLKKLLSFLNVPWNDTVLNHQNYINKPGGISLSNLERSTDQVIKPINLEALSKWVGQFPEDVVKDMPQIAPMLSVLGYDPSANPPNYGEPDSFVLRNMEQIKRNKEAWDEKERKLSNLRETIRKNLAKQQGAKNKDESDNDAVQSNDSYRKVTDSQSNN